MRYKAVFFDFDYTLGDATQAIAAGYEFALSQMGWPKPTLEAVRRTVAYTVQDAYTMLTGDRDEARREQARELFAQIARPMQLTTTKLFDGAKELLEGLHEQGVKLAVISSKGGDTLRKVNEVLGIHTYFALIVGGNDVTRPKPDPEGVAYAMAQLGLQPHEVLYCGDSLVDARTAQNAGVDFCAVLNGTTTAGEMEAYPHVHIAPDLVEAAQWLGVSE